MTEQAASGKRAEKASKRKADNPPPTGTVTFLFTDIEGSTSMWERNPVQMQQALARHDRILRGAIEAHEGFVFKTVGDAFCAAFATAWQALEATLAAQRALRVEQWGEGIEVRARMALHTGVAEERDGDYFGPPVNRVARLESAGHGGQILLSAVTYGLVRDALIHLEPGAELEDLGEHRLKDLRHAERIYQLVASDLPAEFPALKTLDTRSDERYELKELIGRGGMAEVYLAHDKELDRDVAFKVLKNQFSDDEQFVERFKREARSAASLSHPNIVSVYDRGKTQDGAHYIVMEHVPGGTLEERIEREGPLLSTALSLTLQIACALRVAHERGMVHRDVKPQNVLLTESGEVKVADFGIARAASSSTMTKTGFVMGTVYYLSPEQALGEPAGPRSDLYSLGVVLYEMLTGEVPHDAETPMGIAMKHIEGLFRPPRMANPDVPEWVNAVTVRLLAKDPTERYQDAPELIEDLERMQRGEPPAFLAATGPREAASPASTTPASLPGGAPKARDAGFGDERYAIKELLGSGGMAEVYLAHDEELGRDVAFKKLRPQYADDEDVVERFRREAKNAASLSHPNIVSIHDRGKTHDGAYYIVMECAPGGTLKERIQREGTLPAGEVVSLALQVTKALEAAHERGMIHRDVKPQNVLLTESGEAKVADFGIARAASSTTMTKTGAVMGTAHYLSPEQALGNPATPKSDLYSLGVVLYEMLTGEVPHDAETPVGVAMKHISAPLRPPKEVNPEIPEGLNTLVVRLLAKDPEERYPDAAGLIEDLERVRQGEFPEAAAARPEVVGVSPAPGGAAPDQKPAEPSRNRQGFLAGSKRLVLLGTAMGLLLVLLTGGGAMALTGFGPAAGLLGGSEQSPPVDEDTTAQSPDPQESAIAQKEATEETTEETAESKEEVVSTPSGSSPASTPAPTPAPKESVEPTTVQVPDLAGQSRSEAGSRLAGAGLKLGDQNEASDDKVPEGKIIGQNPAAGAKAEPGSSVDITISSGAKQVSVPNLVGLPVSDALGKITAEGLKLGNRKEEPSDNVTQGKVITQDPAPGTKAKQDSPVNIVCSCGSPEDKGKDKAAPPQQPQQKSKSKSKSD